METSVGADRVIAQCAGVVEGERVFILRDAASDPALARELIESACRSGAKVAERLVSSADLSATAEESSLPTDLVEADLLVGVTEVSLYHSALGRLCAARGGRVLAMTGCDESTLTSGGIEANFSKAGPQAEALAKRLDAASNIRITTRAGTDLTASIAGRPGACCPGLADKPGDRSGFPDIEGFVAPVEETIQGVLVADISSTSLGLLQGALEFTIVQGIVEDIRGQQAEQMHTYFAQFGSSPLVVAEFGFGLNPRSHLVGKIVEDEGRLGTGHVAIGNNLSFGGHSDAPFHEDFVYWHPTVDLDGETIITEGVHNWIASTD